MKLTRRKYIAAVAAVAVVGLWVSAAPFLADALVAKKPLAKADAILVLSGSAEYPDRTRAAADAFKLGSASKIFLTNDGRQGGWIESEKRNAYFVELAYAELLHYGVPADAIETLPGFVRGTYDEASLVVSLAADRELNSILLFTSPYHSRRSLWTFQRAAERSHVSIAFGVLTPPGGYRYPSRLNWWTSLYGWESVGAEYVKFAYYWLFH